MAWSGNAVTGRCRTGRIHPRRRSHPHRRI